MRPESEALTRGMTGMPVSMSCGRKEATVVRPRSFSAQGTASSMSGTKASGASPKALVSILGLFPGHEQGAAEGSHGGCQVYQ